MNIAIIGSRGIPNNYGGFEQYAEYLSCKLVQRGHSVTVYNPHFHPYAEKYYKGVKLQTVFSPEKQLGSAANFVYDYLSLRNAVRKRHDIVLACGYQSTSLSYILCNPKRTVIVTNMDGLEWMRAKWTKPVKKITKWFEKMAVKKSHGLISDNLGIQSYISERYGVQSCFIPYGADIFEQPDESILVDYFVEKYSYNLIIARLEPENNLEIILEGYSGLNAQPLLIIGNYETKYGSMLKNKYANNNVRFLGAIYDKTVLDNLRYFSLFYFHGHAVGGTNPSLLEAMSCGAFIIAHDNIFCRSVLGEDAIYFRSSSDISEYLREENRLVLSRRRFSDGNIEKIRRIYSWDIIVSQHEQYFQELQSKLRK